MSDKNLDQTFLSGSNSVFMSDLLNKWENDPKSVPEEWSNWFKEIGSEIGDKGPSWAKENNRVVGAVDVEESVKAVAQGVAGKGKISASDLRSATTDSGPVGSRTCRRSRPNPHPCPRPLELHNINEPALGGALSGLAPNLTPLLACPAPSCAARLVAVVLIL